MPPFRRDLLVATGATLALSGCLEADSSDTESDTADTESEEGDDAEPGASDAETGEGDDAEPGASDADGSAPAAEPPFEIETVDAPGSEAGTATVPRSDQHLLVNFTRTQCPTSAGALEPIGDARAALTERYDVGDDGDVAFLSVTDGTQGPTPTPDELADWWVEHEAEWPIGIDEAGVCNDYYEIDGFPTLVAIDADGDVYWRSEGAIAARNVESALEARLEGGSDDDDDAADTDPDTDRSDM